MSKSKNGYLSPILMALLSGLALTACSDSDDKSAGQTASQLEQAVTETATDAKEMMDEAIDDVVTVVEESEESLAQTSEEVVTAVQETTADVVESAKENVAQASAEVAEKAAAASEAVTQKVESATAAVAAKAAPATAAADQTEMLALAKKSGCLSCHSVDNKIVGPAWRDVAAKYRGQSDAKSKIIDSITHGSTGKWGNFVMPANSPRVDDQTIATLAGFVLSLE